MSRTQGLLAGLVRFFTRRRRLIGTGAPTEVMTRQAPRRKPQERSQRADIPPRLAQVGVQRFDKAAIQAMPDFDGLPPTAIEVVRSLDAAAAACRELTEAAVVGFDTESKPTFNKGERSQGPHLVQLSTATRAYLFPLQGGRMAEPLRALLASPDVRKVGFDLRSDKQQLADNYGLRCQGIEDLVPMFRKAGFRSTVGAVQAVALLFGRYYRKSKSAKMSNWAAPALSESQKRYAANDAYVALRVYLALTAR
ncbi:3'-5' exonuclease [Chitinimonas koreensis]|uniref:3'-5' exonuclease n=1 Tax=Chitinimonas koreensis TaxID=356302 RepID=UPI001B7F9622|nr:3'-5' exonuclease [Chitinimonas koreensis]